MGIEERASCALCEPEVQITLLGQAKERPQIRIILYIISASMPVLAIDIAYTIYLMTENFSSASATIYMGE